MKKEALSQFGHPDLILLSFLLFFFCFLGVVVWAMLQSNKDHFIKMSNMPLTEDNNGGSHE